MTSIAETGFGWPR